MKHHRPDRVGGSASAIERSPVGPNPTAVLFFPLGLGCCCVLARITLGRQYYNDLIHSTSRSKYTPTVVICRTTYVLRASLLGAPSYSTPVI